MSSTRDWFADAFGGSVADIRQKLIDEAWFGRTTTPRPSQGRDHGEMSPLAEHFGWDRVLDEKTFPDRAAEKAHLQSLEAEHERSQRSPSPDHDIDR
jgi:hypothetical protein